jgi:hypothetical protein
MMRFSLYWILILSSIACSQSATPFVEHIVDCGSAQLPTGVYDKYSKRTFIVYPGCSGGLDELCSVDPYIIYYDHRTQSWSPFLQVGVSPIQNDTHCNPQVVIDSQHFIHVFNGGHGHTIQHFRSTVRTDHSDILAAHNWQTLTFDNTNLQDEVTYLTLVKDAASEIYLFYRQTEKNFSSTYVYEPIYYIKSSDDGQTWQTPRKLVDPGWDTDHWNTIYRRGIYHDPKTDLLHYTFALTYSHNTAWGNLYYLCFDLKQDRCFTPAGVDLGPTAERTEFDNPNYNMQIFSYAETTPHYAITDVSVDALGRVHVIHSEEINESGYTTVHRRIWQGMNWSAPEDLFPWNTDKIGVWGAEYGDEGQINYFVHMRQADNSLDQLKIIKLRGNQHSEETIVSYDNPPGVGFFTAFEEIVNAHPDLRRTFMWCDPHGWWQPEPTGMMFAWGDRGVIPPRGLDGMVDTRVNFTPNRIRPDDGYTLTVQRGGEPYSGELDYDLRYCKSDFSEFATSNGVWTFNVFEGTVQTPTGLNLDPGLYLARFKGRGALDAEYSDFEISLVDDREAVNELSYGQADIQMPPPGSYMIFENRDESGSFTGYTRIDIETDAAEGQLYTMRVSKTSPSAIWNPEDAKAFRFGLQHQVPAASPSPWLVTSELTSYEPTLSFDQAAQSIAVSYDGNDLMQPSTQGLLGGVFRDQIQTTLGLQEESSFHRVMLPPDARLPLNLSTDYLALVELTVALEHDRPDAPLVDLWHLDVLQPQTGEAVLRTRSIETNGRIEAGFTSITSSIITELEWRQDGLFESITQWVDVDPLCWRDPATECAQTASNKRIATLIDWYIPDPAPLSVHFVDSQTGEWIDQLHITSGESYQMVVSKADGTPYSGFLQCLVDGQSTLRRDNEGKPIYVSHGIVSIGPEAYGCMAAGTFDFQVRPYLTNSSLHSLEPVTDSQLLPNTSTAAYSNRLTLSIGSESRQTLSVEVVGQGTVTLFPGETKGSDTWQSSFEFGTRLFLTTTPDEGAFFSHWLINGEKHCGNQIDLTLTQPAVIQAHFIAGQHAPMLTVAAIKVPVAEQTTPDVTAVLQKIKDTVQDVPELDLIITPNYTFSRFNGVDLNSPAVRFDYDTGTGIYTIASGQEENRVVPILQEMMQLAGTHQVNMVLGTVAEAQNDYIFNSQLIIDKSGHIIGIHRSLQDGVPQPLTPSAEQQIRETIRSFTLRTASGTFFSVLPLIETEYSDVELRNRCEQFDSDIVALSMQEAQVDAETITRMVYQDQFDPTFGGWNAVIKEIFIDQYVASHIVQQDYGTVFNATGQDASGGILHLHEPPAPPRWLETDDDAVVAEILLQDESIQFSLVKGWNIVSVPGRTRDMSVASLFPVSLDGIAFQFENGRYVQVQTLEPGKGYWIKCERAMNQTIELSSIGHYRQFFSGKAWHLTGSVAEAVDVAHIAFDPPGMTVPPVYTLDTSTGAYKTVNHLEPATGYWIYLSKDVQMDVDIHAVDNQSQTGNHLQTGPPPLPPPPGATTAVETSGSITRFHLLQNYPNPFNAETRIEYALPHAAPCFLAVYNIHGQRIRILFDGLMNAGSHAVRWDGTDKAGEPVPSGIYIIHLQTANQKKSIKCLMVR